MDLHDVLIVLIFVDNFNVNNRVRGSSSNLFIIVSDKWKYLNEIESKPFQGSRCIICYDIKLWKFVGI